MLHGIFQVDLYIFCPLKAGLVQVSACSVYNDSSRVLFLEVSDLKTLAVI